MKPYNKEKKKEYYEANKEKIKEKKKDYYEANKEKKKEKRKEYYKANKEQIKEYGKEYYEANKEKKKEYGKEYYEANKEKIKELNKDYVKTKRETQPLFKLKMNLSCSIRNAFKNKGFRKNAKSEKILGCSIQEFREHLENQFQPWMTWDNYGKYNGELYYGWDLDHIIPLATASTEEDIIRLNHFTNFQPLCSFTNRYIKRDNI